MFAGWTCMQLSHLSLTNFRNYARLELDFDSGVTVLQGDNAQGKTNLLESLHILATTKALRGVNDRELVNWVAREEPGGGARLAADVISVGTAARVEVGVSVQPAEGDAPASLARRYRINGVPRRAADVLGNLVVVLFSPADVDLVAGSPAVRRRYLDIAISQVDHRYLRSLQQYQRVLLQRNHLLRQIRDGRARSSQLEFWDLQLVEHGAYILAARLGLVAALNESIATTHSELVGRPERLALAYQTTAGAASTTADERLAMDALSAVLRQRLTDGREKERLAGASLYGPHRDDLRFTIDGVDVQIYGSRGQQRTVALAVKLAESATIARLIGVQPVLLLDDVMSELDPHRRRHVLDSIRPDQQVILTCTDLAPLDPAFVSRAVCLSVVDGRVAPAGPLPAAGRA